MNPSTSPRPTPLIILITGIMAAGKSTVAQALAARLPKSVHLRGDLFRRMIVNGQAQMNFELSAEAAAQLHLRYTLATTVAKMYCAAGFSVVYQDIILGPTLAEIVEQLQPHPIQVVVLCPAAAEVAMRAAARGKTGYRDVAEITSFQRVLLEETPRIGLWVDSSTLTVEETVNQIWDELKLRQSTLKSTPV